MQLLLIRHALPVHQKVETGTADPELAPHGHLQAQALADGLANEKIDAVYASTMARARQTAEPLATLRGLEITLDSRLVEADSKSPQYTPVHILAKTNPEKWERMKRGAAPEMEDYPKFKERVIASVESIIQAHPGRQTVAVFAHAWVLNAYLAHILDIDQYLPFVIDYTGVSKVIATRDGRRVAIAINQYAYGWGSSDHPVTVRPDEE